MDQLRLPPDFDPSMYPQPTGDPSVKLTVLASTWSMFIAASLFLALRLYCRIARTKQTWWDDWLLLLGWVLLVSSLSLQTYMFANGYLYTTLGDNTITPRNLASDSLMKLALAATKTSFALTLIRLVGDTKSWIIWVVASLTFLTDVMMFIHAILVWKSTCGSPENTYTIQPCWDPCSGLWLNFAGSMVSGVGDFALSVIPLAILWNLQMARREKLGVGIAMSMGLIAGAVAIVKAVATWRVMLVTGPAFGRELMYLSIYIHAEVDAAIIATSIAILRTLLRDVKRRYTSGRRSASRRYIRSDTHSKFHSNARTTTRATEADGQSETSILPIENYKSGIVRTSQVTVSHSERYGNHHGEQEVFDVRSLWETKIVLQPSANWF